MSKGNNHTSTLWTIVGTLFSVSGLAAAGAAVAKIYKARGEYRDSEDTRKAAARKEVRAGLQHDFDVLIADYKGQLTALQQEFAAYRASADSRFEGQRKFWDDKLNTVTSQNDSEISAIRRESADQINKLRDDAYRARIESEKLRGYVQMLQAANAQLRAGSPLGGMEQLPEGNITIDQDGRIRQVDGAFLQMVRYESERELVGRSVSMLVPPERRADHEASLKKIRETGAFPDPKSIIYTDIYTRDSMRVPVSAQFAAWKGSDGKLIFHVTVRERFDESAPSLQDMKVAPDFAAPTTPAPTPIPPPPPPPEAPNAPQA